MQLIASIFDVWTKPKILMSPLDNLNISIQVGLPVFVLFVVYLWFVTRKK